MNIQKQLHYIRNAIRFDTILHGNRETLSPGVPFCQSLRWWKVCEAPDAKASHFLSVELCIKYCQCSCHTAYPILYNDNRLCLLSETSNWTFEEVFNLFSLSQGLVLIGLCLKCESVLTVKQQNDTIHDPIWAHFTAMLFSSMRFVPCWCIMSFCLQSALLTLFIRLKKLPLPLLLTAHPRCETLSFRTLLSEYGVLFCCQKLHREHYLFI